MTWLVYMSRDHNIATYFLMDAPTTECYTLSLHDALPISKRFLELSLERRDCTHAWDRSAGHFGDRKSTRLNSSHTVISYAVCCLRKNSTSCRGRRWTCMFPGTRHAHYQSRYAPTLYLPQH